MAVTIVLNVQTDLLGIMGQEAVAHAALIFASLTAAFAFATGFKKKVDDRLGKLIYVGFLGPLIGIAIYAVFRMYLWGTLLGVVLDNPPALAFTKCLSVKPSVLIPVGSLTLYWYCVNKITGSALYLNFITVRTLSTSLFSLCVGFITSIGLLMLVLKPEQRISEKRLIVLSVVFLLVCLSMIVVGSILSYS